MPSAIPSAEAFETEGRRRRAEHVLVGQLSVCLLPALFHFQFFSSHPTLHIAGGEGKIGPLDSGELLLELNMSGLYPVERARRALSNSTVVCAEGFGPAPEISFPESRLLHTGQMG
ncbi:MAG: hypothetical protein NZ602_08460 [Thermoguttaceae bacterium]|nr:hypothetical protein [Thermoguttaceae bacterium]MDW8037926.1 hypothetical protein [Thermoguttaceae bacterium]